eukprot:TRINITY_DN1955_c0_g2_i1.p1 TRINITY_DN1955_c0_g2~~TRINITY_DN1955_c0_g2_i1.p1  ORF type:complete len:429 (+),score=81.22 TRINITY_DN1955_c0_g2_i1:28-1287(+)
MSQPTHLTVDCKKEAESRPYDASDTCSGLLGRSASLQQTLTDLWYLHHNIKHNRARASSICCKFFRGTPCDYWVERHLDFPEYSIRYTSDKVCVACERLWQLPARSPQVEKPEPPPEEAPKSKKRKNRAEDNVYEVELIAGHRTFYLVEYEDENGVTKQEWKPLEELKEHGDQLAVFDQSYQEAQQKALDHLRSELAILENPSSSSPSPPPQTSRRSASKSQAASSPLSLSPRKLPVNSSPTGSRKSSRLSQKSPASSSASSSSSSSSVSSPSTASSPATRKSRSRGKKAEPEIGGIVDMKVEDGVSLYRVRYKGHFDKDDEWLPESDLVGAEMKLAAYKAALEAASESAPMESSNDDASPNTDAAPNTDVVPNVDVSSHAATDVSPAVENSNDSSSSSSSSSSEASSESSSDSMQVSN